MRKVLQLGLLLSLLAARANAAIGASGTAAVCTAFASSSSGSITRNEAAGNTVVAVIAIRTTTTSVLSIADSGPGGSTYTQCSGCAVNNGTNVRVEVWTTAVRGSTSATTVTVTLQGGASKWVGCVFEYTGVAALGSVTATTANVANPSFSVTTQDANNWCTAGFAGQGTGTFTAGTGTLRASAVTSGAGATSNVGGAQVDNGPIASPGACTTSVTNADTVWALVSLELRSVAPAGCAGSKSIALLGAGCK